MTFETEVPRLYNKPFSSHSTFPRKPSLNTSKSNLLTEEDYSQTLVLRQSVVKSFEAALKQARKGRKIRETKHGGEKRI